VAAVLSVALVSVPSLNDALSLHQSGRFADAADAYQTILAATPDDPNALHLLGVVELQQGDAAAAVDHIGRAIAIRPNVGAFHLNHASALRSAGRIDDAIAEAERAIALDPSLAAGGYHIAGLAFADGGQPEDAIFCWRKALEADPNHYEARVHLGRALRAAGEFPAALAEAKTLVARRPDDAIARYELGASLRKLRDHHTAVAAFDEALARDPRLAAALVEKGWTLGELDDFEAAAAAFTAAIAIDPKEPSAYLGLGVCHGKLGDPEACARETRQAVVLDPHETMYRSALLHSLHYIEADSRALFEDHLQWSQWHAAQLRTRIKPHANDRNPGRPLRVGFVSADFCGHPVARFMQPVLSNCDRGNFSFVCYSATTNTDAATDRLIERAGEWHEVTKLSPEDLAEKIRADRIDILVDLAGHTARNRLLTFARKPAPVQVTMFGYTDTTGLSTVDYRITDALSDPPGATERFHTEQLARLPEIAYCYEAPPGIPEMTPRDPRAPVVFGSLNNNQKVTPPIARVWQRILDGVPGSRLLFLTVPSPDVIRPRLAAHGLDVTRVDVVRNSPVPEYFDLFNRIDVALDPYPFNGGVTTCDTLFMGVPLVTRAGDRYVSRQGLSLLTHVGLRDLVAHDDEGYVRVAVALANDVTRRAALRKSLRPTVLASPIGNGARYTRHLEQFFRDAWRRWCAG
jgi:predicted O-linked N-acetylglucosamine transferase (SPINDLY family)